MKSALKLGITNNHIDLEQFINWYDKNNFTIRPALSYDMPFITTNKYDYKISLFNDIISSKNSYILELYFYKLCEHIFIIRIIFLYIAKIIYSADK